MQLIDLAASQTSPCHSARQRLLPLPRTADPEPGAQTYLFRIIPKASTSLSPLKNTSPEANIPSVAALSWPFFLVQISRWFVNGKLAIIAAGVGGCDYKLVWSGELPPVLSPAPGLITGNSISTPQPCITAVLT